MSTKIIAHRGAWKEFNLPENSLEALQQAINIHCDAVELDVHLTQDYKVVVHHDHDFYGLKIETTPYIDLLAKKHSNGEPLPTLNDFVTLALNNKMKLFVEVKSSELGFIRTQKLIDVLLENLPEQATTLLIEFILFDFNAALYLKQNAPNFLVHYLEGDKSAKEIKHAALNGMDYNYKLLVNNPQIIHQFKNLGLQTNSWTVNDFQIAQKLINHSIDYITTDYPQTFKNKL